MGGGSKAPTGPATPGDRLGATAVPASLGAPVSRGGQSFGCAWNTNEASRGPGHAHCRRGQGAAPPRLPPPPHTLLPRPARAGGAGGASSGFATLAPRLAPQPRVRAPASTLPWALPARAPPTRAPARLHARGRGYRVAGTQPHFVSRPVARAPKAGDQR